MATQTEINIYIDGILDDYTVFASNLSNKQRIGMKELSNEKLRFRLAGMMVKVMVDYLLPGAGNYSSSNFFTNDEAEDVMNHINRLIESDRWLDL